ncbi:helix-turn-helix domain-containing protein [Paraburkholderia sp. J67]|uniref:TetR/AcrR family transcriptional regulator n=1 Tax=Paraburkholderia sp. J67 TaxID=2805435 RepID=UPI002ABE7407|nr:helix-turn-helix domain-containing protein [Paraburkholderia sp. J67]
MSTVEPNAQRAAALRARILDAARRIVMREGIDALSMRKIADAIGYSAASLYSHFEGRDAIARALGHEGFAQLLARLEPCCGIVEPRERLYALAHAYVAFGYAHAETYRLMFLPPREPLHARERERAEEAATPAPAADADLDSETAAIAALFAEALAPVCADPVLLARALWALLHGLVCFSFLGPAFAPEAARLPTIDAALDRWLDGQFDDRRGPTAAQNTPADTT